MRSIAYVQFHNSSSSDRSRSVNTSEITTAYPDMAETYYLAGLQKRQKSFVVTDMAQMQKFNPQWPQGAFERGDQKMEAFIANLYMAHFHASGSP